MYYKGLTTWLGRGLKGDRVRFGGVLRRGLGSGLENGLGYCDRILSTISV